MAAPSKYNALAPLTWIGIPCCAASMIREYTLKLYATQIPNPISVNMFRLRVNIVLYAFASRGAPIQNTTGVARATCNHPDSIASATLPGRLTIGAIATAMSDAVRTLLIKKRRFISVSSRVSAASTNGECGSSDIPHSEQAPGSAWLTSACIGQV